MLHHRMSVPLVLDDVTLKVCIPLMCRSQLMMANHLVAGDLLPFRGPYVMLGVHKWVADEADVRQDTNKVGGRHRVPLVPVDFCVVDLSGYVGSTICRDWTPSRDDQTYH